MYRLMMTLEKQSKPFKIFLGFALIGAIGEIDFLTGYEVGLSVFYVIPISLLTWFISRRLGIIASFVSACVWGWADRFSGHVYSHPFIPIWNICLRLSFFVIITLLLSALKRALEHEKELARTDHLTGSVNSRFFFELVQMEIDRSRRHKHPFTIVYIDLDNFKTVNDRFGHPTGDQALRSTAGFIRTHTRKTDVIARLGGDEFALLLPETDHESASVVLSKLRSGLSEQMQQNNWPITFSMGALICSEASPNVEDLIRMADDLMYSVKRDGKNAIRYSDA